MNRLLAGFLVLSVCTSAVRADGDVPIRDAAKLFSPEAAARAAGQIRDIRRRFHVDFVLETTDTLAKDVVERLDRSNNPDRTFGEIALERARAADVQGIYVYVSTKPKHQSIAAVVWPEKYRDVFDASSCERVRRVLARKLKKQPDEALQQAIELVREEVAPKSSWFGVGTVVALVGGVLLLWVVLGLVRMHTAEPTPAAQSPERERPGFVPGLLGGMFGTVAGHWIYDTLFQSPPVAVVNAVPPNGSTPPAAPNNAPNTGQP